MFWDVFRCFLGRGVVGEVPGGWEASHFDNILTVKIPSVTTVRANFGLGPPRAPLSVGDVGRSWGIPQKRLKTYF